MRPLVQAAERLDIVAKGAGVTNESGATSVNDIGPASIMFYDSEHPGPKGSLSALVVEGDV